MKQTTKNQKYVIYFVLAKESTTNRNNFYLCYY